MTRTSPPVGLTQDLDQEHPGVGDRLDEHHQKPGGHPVQAVVAPGQQDDPADTEGDDRKDAED